MAEVYKDYWAILFFFQAMQLQKKGNGTDKTNAFYTRVYK